VLYNKYSAAGLGVGSRVTCAESDVDPLAGAGQRRPGLPDYTYDEVPTFHKYFN